MATVREIKYTSSDYSSILDDLIQEIKRTATWRDTDFRSGMGRTLLEAFAYSAAQLHWYINRLASEAYIETSKTRNSMINHGKLIGYSVKKPAAATCTLRFRMQTTKTESVTIDAWTRAENADGYEYITTKAVTFPANGLIKGYADQTSVDADAIQGRKINEVLGTSDGLENQQFELSYKDMDTYLMDVYVGKEGYTVVPDWAGFYRPAKTYTNVLDEGDWTADILQGSDVYKARVVHNLDLGDKSLFSISAIDGTTYDGTILSLIKVSGINGNTVDIWYRDATTLMTVDIKDDVDPRIYWPTRDLRIENDSGICRVDYRDEDTMIVEFGDGRIGKIPRLGESIRAEYIKNDGEAGNSGKNTIVTVNDTIVTDISQTVVSDLSVTNTTEATGGADRESLDSIRKWAPLESRTLRRMVTLEDYTVLVSRIHGVLKCQILDVYNPGDEIIPFRQAKVYIIPVGGGTMSATLKKRIEDEIDSKKIVGTVRLVQNVTMDDINITMDLWYSSGFTYSEVYANINGALKDYFAIDHKTREISDPVDYESLLLMLTQTEGVGSVTLLVPSADLTLLSGHYPKLGTLTINNRGVLS